jgi:uncharacterized protein (DUF433 family)
VYSISDAARYAKMPAATIQAWFFPTKDRAPMRLGDIDGGGEKALSFLDFVEALAVRSFRIDYNVSLRAIREAMDFAQSQFNVTHIFARQDHRTLIDARRQLHIILSGEKNPIAISGKGKGQVSFQECIEGYMRDLQFNSDGVAELYTAFRFEGQKVIMRPSFHFGEPIMEENGYPPDVLWRGVIAEGGFERAAELYDVSIASVEAAYRYCHGELRMAAA